MRLLLVVVVSIVGLIGYTQALSCFCGQEPCETPLCCASGVLTSDQCGCCQVCARAERDTCGGPWNIDGICGRNLKCLVKCPCKAEFGNDLRDCVFPFKYKGVEYDECTTAGSENGKAWCALKVDRDGVVVEGQWGDCLEGSCPLNGQQCDTFNGEGRCVRRNARISLNPKLYELRDGLKRRGGQKIKKCDGSETRCRCDPNQEKNEETGEGCTPHFNAPPGSHGWCWLENVVEPRNPHFKCFEDAVYSARNGRFWSSQACLPNIAFAEELGAPPLADDGPPPPPPPAALGGSAPPPPKAAPPAGPPAVIFS